MPSPMPPKPPRSFCASSLKFQVVGSALLLSGLVAVDIHVSVAWLCGKAGAVAPAVVTTMGTRPSSAVSGACLLEEFSTQRLAPVRHRLDLVFLQENFGLPLHVGHEVGWPSRLDFDPRQCLGKGVLR